MNTSSLVKSCVSKLSLGDEAQFFSEAGLQTASGFETLGPNLEAVAAVELSGDR